MRIKNDQQLLEILNSEQLHDFSDYVKEVTGNSISELTGEKINDLYDDFEVGKLSNNLCDKVTSEYVKFIENMKKQSIDYIIEAAYEIVWKDNITQFIETEPPKLSKKQYVALLSANNTLAAIYDEWLSDGELHTYADIAVLLENTAGKILVSLNKELEE